jgi:hypothetical protein
MYEWLIRAALVEPSEMTQDERSGGDGSEPVTESKAKRPVEVRAVWDDEAGVWSAEGENLPGLVTEADSYQLLMQKLQIMVPELLSYSPDLRENLGPEIHLILERNFTAEPSLT